MEALKVNLNIDRSHFWITVNSNSAEFLLGLIQEVKDKSNDVAVDIYPNGATFELTKGTRRNMEEFSQAFAEKILELNQTGKAEVKMVKYEDLNKF